MTNLLTTLLTTAVAAFAVPAFLDNKQHARKTVNPDEMIQGGMVMAMAAKLLTREPKELAGLSA